MSNVLDLINRIASTTKKTEKVKILREVLPGGKNEHLREPLWMALKGAYDPGIKFGTKSFPWPDGFTTGDDALGLHAAIRQAINLSLDGVRGKKLKARLEAIAGRMTEDDATVFVSVIAKNLNCGVNAKLANDAFPDLIELHPYMRCSPLSVKGLSRLSPPYICEEKLDGLYVDILVRKGKPNIVRSRNGKNLDKLISQEMINVDPIGDDYVLMGEALVFNEDSYEVLPRSLGNGYINSDDVDIERIVIDVWDCVPYADWKSGYCPTKRMVRIEDTENAVGYFFNHAGNKSCLRMCDIKVFHSLGMVLDAYRKYRNMGREGVVLKSFEGIWKDGTSRDQMKIKAIADCDLIVTGVNPGTGKNANLIGSVDVETLCGKIKCSVSGFTDSERLELSELGKGLIGRIFTIEFNDIVSCNGVDSLFLPRFVELRTDKSVPNTKEEVIESLETVDKNIELIFLEVSKVKR